MVTYGGYGPSYNNDMNTIDIATTGSAVDFGDAGKNLEGTTFGNRTYMIPPKISTAQRTALVGHAGLATETGAFIYNSDINKMQVYTGNDWETITST